MMPLDWDSSLGCTWGRARRDALAVILEKTFGVQVLTIDEYDD